MTATSPADDAATDYDRQLGARIREARNAAGITQVELGELLNLSRASIANIEGARQRIAAGAVVQIGRALGADPRWLLTGDTYAPRPNAGRRLSKADIAHIHRATLTLRTVADALDTLAGDTK